MKIFLLLFSIITLLISCTNDPCTAIKEITESTYSASEESGKTVIRVLKSSTSTEYNRAGKKVKKHLYYEYDESTSITTYNSDGKLIKTESYNKAGEITSTTTYEYNSEGKKVKREFKTKYSYKNDEPTPEGYNNDGDDEIRSTITYEYNSDGKVVKEDSYHEDEIELSVKYEYNDEGNLEKSETRNGDGELEGTFSFEYNSDGKKLIQRSRDRNSETLSITYTANYNTADQLIQQEQYNPDIGLINDPKTGKLNTVIKYEYNSDGKVIVIKQEYYDYYYDELGKEVKEENIDKYKYTKFDTQNNWIEQKHYSNGKVVEITKREIIYYD